MKVRQLSGFLFLAILVLFVSSIVVQAEGCEFADRLVEADLFKEALDNYTTLLTENSTSICAKSGIGNATNGSILRLLKLGESYNLSNQTNEARIAYNEALKKDPNNDTAINALKNIAIVVPDTGINVYIENINNFLYYILYFFALIFGLYLICIALKLKIYPWWKEIDKPRLDIQDFDKGATELDIGKGLTSMVEESIIRNTKGSPWWSIDQVQSSIKSLDIPADIKSISSYFKFLVDLIEWIFPSNVIRVEGSLEKPGDQGAGLTLTMVETRTGKIKASQTIWQKDYDPMMTADAKEKNPVPYYNLAESAAIWTIFEFYANTKVEKELLNKNHNICCKLILRNKYGISYCYYCISYKLNLYKCKIFDFINKKLIFYLFNWEEIPGNDNGRLIDFLKSTFDLDWVKEAEIKKSEDKSTIIVDTKSKSLSLMLNDDKTKVNIKIDDGRTDELIARTENCNLNIYIRSIWKYICCISRCDFHDASTFRLLNTSDWKSYACFRAGVRLFEDEKFDKALIMFLNALEYDPKNAGALYNAGVLFMVEGEYYKALEYFDCLITITKNKPDLVFFEYASTYQIAATYLYIELKKEKYKKKIENILLKVTGIDEIIKVKEICESIKCAIDNYEKSKQKLKSAKEDWNNLKNNMIKINYSELICDLYSLIPLLDELLCVNVFKLSGELKTKEQDLSKRIALCSWEDISTNNNKLLMFLTKYEICNDANKIETPDEKSIIFTSQKKSYCLMLNDKKTELIIIIDNNLERKFIIKKEENRLNIYENEFMVRFRPLARIMCAGIKAHSKDEEDMKKAREIIEGICGNNKENNDMIRECKNFCNFTSDVYYSLACYYSIKKEYENAIKYLDRSLERRDYIVGWANKDPELKDVREDECTKEKFASLIKKYSPQQEQLPLSDIKIIGETFAKKLKDQGIISTRDLIILAGKPPSKRDTSRQELAKKLGITTTLLQRWVNMANMMHILGIDALHANLLEAAEVGSIDELEKINFYLFSWEEIPGNDSEKLTDFLKSNYGVDLVKTAEIAKTDNGKTIIITTGKSVISLNLFNENTELNLIIDNDKTDKFIVKTENGKLNIYMPLSTFMAKLCQKNLEGSFVKDLPSQETIKEWFEKARKPVVNVQ